jgi:hypothetical protein
MRSRVSSWLVALLFACLAAGAATWGYQEHQRVAVDSDFAQKRQQLLQTDNARLQALVADQKKEIAAAYEAKERKEIEQAVVSIRGLDFKEPVVYETVTHEDIKKILAEKLAQQYSDEDFKHIAASYAALGLLEPNYPLKDKYIALLGEQIAAFYDQHQHKLFMFEDASLHDVQNRVVLAHELTHALQDQHFGLLRMPLEIKHDDDLSLAASSLIEGDATVLMAEYEAKTISLQTFTDSVSDMLSQNMVQLQRAPRFLRETLFFPYSHGRDFCMALYQRGGYEAISGAFKHPPASSTQILHPEKYFAHEEPVPVEWPDTSVDGKKPTDDNVLGEFGTRVLFEKYMDAESATAAAEGWRGDRYIVFDDGQGLVWKTLWIDEEHAQNFRDALLRYVGKRFKQSTTDTSNPGCVLFSSPECTGEIINAKSGNGIIFIWGTTKELNGSLMEKFKE